MRLQLNLLDPETNYFLFATYLGKKRLLSFGVSADYQHETESPYRALAADVAVDLPLGPGGFAAELDVIYRNGGNIVDLPEQVAVSAEAGYRIDALRISPVVRFERRWAVAAGGDEIVRGGGLSFWAYGHTSNIKAFYQRITPEAPTRPFEQINLQWQLAFF